MKPISAEYSFDGSVLTLSFSAPIASISANSLAIFHKRSAAGSNSGKSAP
ncbi:MAG: hypothetical protein R2845_11260 [Thermomicrobiales bacterium]